MPPRGYYELAMTVRVADPQGAALTGGDTATFGVMEQPKYDFATFMKEGRRFGLKWWGGVSNHEETKRMIDALGLNWSRAIFRADTSHERWKLDPLDGNVRPENPTVWSIMEFTE